MSACILWLVSLWSVPTAEPRPDLTPSAVVEIVLAALRKCNSPIPNAGVFTAYRFASPANHAVTGPYGRFLRAVKTPDFAPMLHDDPWELDGIQIKGDRAEQILRIRHTDAPAAVFRLSLSRQREGRYQGCWMMDGVRRLP